MLQYYLLNVKIYTGDPFRKYSTLVYIKKKLYISRVLFIHLESTPLRSSHTCSRGAATAINISGMLKLEYCRAMLSFFLKFYLATRSASLLGLFSI